VGLFGYSGSQAAGQNHSFHLLFLHACLLLILFVRFIDSLKYGADVFFDFAGMLTFIEIEEFFGNL